MGLSFTTSINDIELTVHIQSVSTVICCSTLSWYDRLQQKCFCASGCNIIAHEKPSQWRTWASHGHYGYSLGPAMHHYRCQNVYITSTASKRIVDPLCFFPFISPMPQSSSTARLLMAANNMADALKHLHPDVPFATFGDDTITAVSQLAKII
jgi:hypothetical protein